MADKLNEINVIKSTSFTNRVENKKREIKENSVFQSLNGDNSHNDYVEEAAFLLGVYDKDNSGNIKESELNSVKCSEVDKKEREYDPTGEKLILTSCNDVKAELRREIKNNEVGTTEQIEKSGFNAPLNAAITSEADINNATDYKKTLLEISNLKKSAKDDAKSQSQLLSDEITLNALDIIMSPEARKRIKKEVHKK